MKRLEYFDSNDVVNAFERNDIQVYNETNELQEFLLNTDWHNHNLLLMSSGNFFGLDLNTLSSQII